MSGTHWHIGTGLAGYGPDAADGGVTVTADVLGAARAASEELDRAADHATDVANSYGESGDYESAWKTHKLAESLDMASTNLDVDKRQRAPLYVDNKPLLCESMAGLLADVARTPLDIRGNVLLYVWQCPDTDCESDDD